MYDFHYLPPQNRATRRKVLKYARKRPNLTFVQAYNELFHTDYREPTPPTHEEGPAKEDDTACTL